MMHGDEIFPQARTTDIVTRDMPDELLVYDLKTNKAHCLNKSAAAVWKNCDGKTSVAEMVVLLQTDFNSTMDEAAVWMAINGLSKAQLLEKRVTVPDGSPRLGRREALRRLGVGSALAVPVVMSIVAPTAQAACTGGGAIGDQCMGTVNNGSSGTVSCTVCLSTCCAGAGNPTAGTCQPLNTLAMNAACTRDCQCASGTCMGSNNTCS